MLDLNNQVWVTSILSEEDVRNAFLLSFSLKRAYTTRKIVAIVHPDLALSLRQALDNGFDFVFHLEPDRNAAGLRMEDFAKIYSLAACQAFENCAYVSPRMMALQNCDDIFADATDGFRLLENPADTSVFLFKPSVNHFNVLMMMLVDNVTMNGNEIGFYLSKWAKNNYKNGKSIDAKYNIVLKNESILVGEERDLVMANMQNYSDASEISKLESNGILGRRVARHWLKIHHEQVLPRLGHGATEVLSSPKPTNLTPRYTKEPIAIVGMSCRYPGSNNIDEFWDMLVQAQDATGNPPPFRWLREQCSNFVADARKTNAGFLKAPVDEFDNKFFGISPKEALFMDPQHRLIHELVWEALEDACVDPVKLHGTSGSIFMGSWLNDYKDILMASENSEFYRAYMGNSIGAGAARISHLLGLTGPSIATESGCSSAIVAVHLACRALQFGETNLALACGVNMLLHQFDKDAMPMVLSPDGHCKTFSEDADGFARAEGGGVLVLKRLSNALSSGDHIWGLIRGSGVSQEGISKSMGTPTVYCESLAMLEALRDAKLAPEEISYVETHGTGTAVGDPMEIAAIAKAYSTPKRKEPLIIGSVKTNVGHTESCSGITGIMKVILSMLYETIPAHRNFTKLNPAIDLDTVPAMIPLESREWKRVDGKPRIAGVSSFGITGTDAHVIIEEPQHTQPQRALAGDEMLEERPLHILKLSAKTEDAMSLLLEKYKDTILTSKDPIADIAFSANTGRANFPLRTAIIAESKEEICRMIEQQKYVKGAANPDSLGKICFLFTGQGSQYPGMARTLYQTSPVFRMHFDHCDKILKEVYQINISKVLWPTNPESGNELSRTVYSQTSIFCVEYALLKLWESWGVKPDYALGHSLGEFGAAVCSGVLSVRDAIKLVAERSKLIDQLPRGKMLIIKALHDDVDQMMKKFANGDKQKMLDYAAINSSQQTVVAGDSQIILDFSHYLTQHSKKCIVLEATHAFHSKHMDPILEDYRAVAKSIQKQKVQNCAYISGMRGEEVTFDKIGAEYWVEHTRDMVRFYDASKKAVERGCRLFVEIGPQPVLSALTMMNNDANLTCLPSLKRNDKEWTTMLSSLAKLYVKGVDIDWNSFDQFQTRRKVRLPHYPFMGKKFWPELVQSTGKVIHPLIGSVIPNASSAKIFQIRLNLRTHEYVKDHAIGQTAIFPGAGYLEMCLAAGLATVEGAVNSMNMPSRQMKVENLTIKSPLAVEDLKTCQLQTVAELCKSKENENDWNDVSIKICHRIESELEEKWLPHAVATFSPLPTAEDQALLFNKDQFLNTLIKPCEDEEDISQLYEKLAAVGLKFGNTFRSIEKMWKGEGNSLLVKVKVPEVPSSQSTSYILHPVVLDAMIQAILMPKLSEKLKRTLYVPIKIGKFVWLSNGNENCKDTLYINVGEKSGHQSDSIALLLDSEGTVLATMSDVEFIDTTVKTVEAVLEDQMSTLPQLWDESWRPQIGPLQYSHDAVACAAQTSFSTEFYNYIVDTYDKMTPDVELIYDNLEKLAYYYMLRCMYQCGFQPALNSILCEKELKEELKIEDEFAKFFGYCLRVLEEEGILQSVEPHTYKVIRIPPTLKQIEDELITPTFTDYLIKIFRPTLLLMKIGENLSKILQGNQSALSIFFPEDKSKEAEWSSVAEFYTTYGEFFRTTHMISDVAETILKQCKRHDTGERTIIRILEIGAGTGSFTEPFIQKLSTAGYEFEYTYTDISAAFFPAAEKRFETYLKNMTFKKLNIEEDPISQGFVPVSYDYIVASDVIHATKYLKDTLANVKLLLKPGGRFDMLEMTQINRFITYLFGLFDGFWYFQDLDLRPYHCIMNTDKWIQTLESSGFDVVKSFPSVKQNHSFILTRRKFDSFGMYHPIMAPQKKLPTWLVFHEEDNPTSNFILKQLPLMANRRTILVTRGAKYEMVVGGECEQFTVGCHSEQDFVQLMNYILNSETIRLEGMVYAWCLGKQFGTQDTILKPFFHLAKAILQMKNELTGFRLVALHQNSAPVLDNDLSNFRTATMWGFLKSLSSERVQIKCWSVDIGDDRSETGMLQIFHELWTSGNETQVAYQGMTRFVPKIATLKPSFNDLRLPVGTDRFQLILPQTKSIGDLKFGPLDPMVLESGEMEIQVRASALNFRDLLSVLKPSEDFKNVNAIGFDFAGVVKRLHPDVTKWRVGDEVFGANVDLNALPSHVKVNQDDVLLVPEDMTLSEAATLPAVVSTSYLCLIDVAKLKPTDIVLIHTASGGVGLSAIEICKHVGCTIIATAGSKRKQNYLRSLGIKHIFHSRNTNFGDKILQLTNGHGVDVVLNSLTSEGFKEATLKACAHGARFVEMSKLSIWKPEEVKALRPDVEYTIADVSGLSSAEWRRLLTILKELTDKRIVNPIPYVRFNSVNIREALQYMQKAKHIGKIVCTMPIIKNSGGKTEAFTPMFNARSTYLITGGLGGIGFEVCKWMVKNGAKHVLLCGRNPPNPNMAETISRLNTEYSAKITTVRLNVANFDECKDLIERKIPEMGFPILRGVMHAAGILRDGLIENQNWESLSSTFGTKVTGTLNLHELTKSNSKLEHFVLFSSIAAFIGATGQSNHAAGNQFEDTFAHYRNSLGLPAQSVNWGQWGQVGIATGIDFPGVKPLSNLQGISGLEYVMKSHETHVGIINVESFVKLSKQSPHITSYLDERVWKKASSSSAGPLSLNSDEFWQQYDKAETTDIKLDILKGKINLILRSILKLDEADKIDDTANFQEMGVDSLMLVEIKNSLQSLFGDRVVIQASALRNCNSMQQLSEILVKVIEGKDLDEKEKPTAEYINQLLKEDCTLPEHIMARPEQERIQVKNVSRVLLTGVTGTLGPYVLRELCRHSQITELFCMIRPKKNLTMEERLINTLHERDLISEICMSKVRCVSGNVAMPQLGMDANVWEELTNNVDAVFHCAASVQHMEIYRREETSNCMRSVNVGGLKNVLEFCSSGSKLKHVYNASTICAAAAVNEEGNMSENWPEPDDFNGVTIFTYPNTKFVGDVVMKEAVTNRGIPGKVFRFPLISGDSRTGRFVLEQNHFMLRYIFAMKNGMIASNPFPLPILPVDICAKVSVKLCLEPNAPNEIYNIINRSPDADQEFASVAKRLGHEIKIVDFAEFSEKILEAAGEDSPMEIFKEFYTNEEDVMSLYNTAPALRQWLVEGGNNDEFFMSKKLAKIMPEFYESGFGKSVPMDHIYRDFLFARDQGWLAKFGLKIEAILN